MHGKVSETSSSGAGTSTIRPRNRRLVSTNTELTSGDRQGISESSDISRDASPIPSRHPSRIASGSRLGTSRSGTPIGGLVTSGGENGSMTPTSVFGKGLWDGGWVGSWTALQGLASSVLGGDINGNDKVGGKNTETPKRRERGPSNVKKPPTTWGPSGSLPRKIDDSIGVGSTAAREAALKARRTASVLQSHERVNGGLDVNGRYKRRTSIDESSHQVHDEDVMVYVHRVQPSDTMAGVILKYNCQPVVFRKANGLWPNDIIQIRKVVLLPVDACAVKGRPCDPPSENSQGVDLLAPTPGSEHLSQLSTYSDGSSWGTSQNHFQDSNPSPFDTISINQPKVDGERPWSHVRWVLIDSSPLSQPVEIARASRSSLGYFPPRRRKSHATTSSISTPKVSLDCPSLPNKPTDSLPSSPGHRTSSLGSKLASGSYFPASASNSSSRRDSSDMGGRANWMRGPGGVGTFAKNVHKPGPAQDGLNSLTAKYLPGLSTETLPSTFVSGGATASLGFEDETSGLEEQTYLNRAATPSGQGSGFEHAAAAIENWVRKLAVKGPGTPKRGTGPSSSPAEGDLIELLIGPGSDDGRGLEPTPTLNVPSNTGGNAREDPMLSMRNRTSQSSIKGKKTD